MRPITSADVVSRLTGYLHHELTLDDLVGWAEEAMMEAEFQEDRYQEIRDIVSRLGVADVRAFGPTWEDCEQYLRRLGCTVRVEGTSPWEPVDSPLLVLRGLRSARRLLAGRLGALRADPGRNTAEITADP